MTQKKSYAARINYSFYKMAVLFGKKSPTFSELPLKWSLKAYFFAKNYVKFVYWIKSFNNSK